jgi:1-acyl-sn-glycerol-3-phosphate acyltransferase
VRAIPIAPAHENSEMMEQAFDHVSEALAQGELVCIFPEGKITDTGQINVFKPGVIRVLERDPVPIVPLALRGLWGSFFSRAYGNAMSRLIPRGLFSRIELVAGDAITERGVSIEELQQRVEALRGDRI